MYGSYPPVFMPPPNPSPTIDEVDKALTFYERLKASLKKEDEEKKEKEKKQKKPEGPSRSDIFWFMLTFSPLIGIGMLNAYIALGLHMQQVLKSITN